MFTNQEHALRSCWALDWIAWHGMIWHAGHLINPGLGCSAKIASKEQVEPCICKIWQTEAKNSEHTLPWLTLGLDDAGALCATGAGRGPLGLWKRSQSHGHFVETTP